MNQMYPTQIEDRVDERGAAVLPGQASAFKAPVIQNVPARPADTHRLPADGQHSRAVSHACMAYQRGYQQARDQLKRADRDLGETVAAVAASLTTATAVEAVVTVAHDKIGLPRDFLLAAFAAYILVFLLVLAWGLVRGWIALHRRARAERDMDQAKNGIFQYCSTEQWLKLEE